MSYSEKKLSGVSLTESMTGSLRWRIRLLVLASTLVVALAFGISFYHALVSNEAAIAQQLPELEVVVKKLKSLLIVNTVGFAVVIIASFYALSVIVTSRMFRPLGFIQKDLMAIADGELPRKPEEDENGPFFGLSSTFSGAVYTLRERELKEIEELKTCAKLLSSMPGTDEALKRIEELISNKGTLLGRTGPEDAAGDTSEGESDELFMQPV